MKRQAKDKEKNGRKDQLRVGEEKRKAKERRQRRRVEWKERMKKGEGKRE